MSNVIQKFSLIPRQTNKIYAFGDIVKLSRQPGSRVSKIPDVRFVSDSKLRVK